ncbi:hypothetical protein A3Q56_07903 [Intoshia linei]|uniref:Uncharacterized protein n=1 Tax=Intoshia linei TaxID=1819745 RepID=A0A177ASP1_9BILA|nr:hypothetical protein A3Q56_07903 [Intoshia linei]
MKAPNCLDICNIKISTLHLNNARVHLKSNLHNEQFEKDLMEYIKIKKLSIVILDQSFKQKCFLLCVSSQG